MNQNQYGPIQLCSRCGNPLEKGRTMRLKRVICRECQKERQRAYYQLKVK